MQNHTMNIREWGLLIVISIVWGLSFFFIEIALLELQPFTLVFYRIGIAAMILIVLVYSSGQRIPFDLQSWKKFFILGLFNNFLPFTLISWGQLHITSSLASILNATTPLITVFLAHYLTRDERMTGNRLAGVIVGIAGVSLLVGPEALRGMSSHTLGQLAIIGAACSYAYGGIYIRELKHVPVLTAISGTLISATLMTFCCVLLFEYPLVMSMQIKTLSSLLGMSVLGTAIAYILYFKLIRTAGATNTLLVTFLVPITALLLGVLILKESISSLAIIGMLVVFSGLVLVDGRVLKLRKRKDQE